MIESALESAPEAASAGERRRAIALWGTLVAVVFAFRESIAAMARLWWTSDTYAHGAFIPFISLYLLYQLRHRLAAIEKKFYWPALLFVVSCGFVWAVAALSDIAVIQQLAVVAILLGVTLLFMGRRWVWGALFPLAFLFLAVPLGDGLTPPLVEMTADFVVVALRWSGIPVYREGSFFIIPSGSWSVVSGCSGMRYLMATITIGLLFAYINYRSMWRRALFVAFAALVAIIGNWLRAYGIVMIAHLSNMKLALGVDHYVYGWVFFGILIFIVMSIGMIWSEPPAPQEPGSPSTKRESTSRVQLLAATSLVMLCALVWPTLIQHLPKSTTYATPNLLITPEVLGSGWSEASLPAPDWKPHYVGATAELQKAYANSAHRIGWHTAWFGLQAQGAEVINAENRLVHEKYDPWRVRVATSSRKATNAMPKVKETILKQRSGNKEILVWQWTWVGGHATTSSLKAKLFGVFSLLRGAGNPGADVLVYTPLLGDETIEFARNRLANAVNGLAPALHNAFDSAARL